MRYLHDWYVGGGFSPVSPTLGYPLVSGWFLALGNYTGFHLSSENRVDSSKTKKSLADNS